jgi:RND family efflux transporter MFP subunit
MKFGRVFIVFASALAALSSAGCRTQAGSAMEQPPAERPAVAVEVSRPRAVEVASRLDVTGTLAAKVESDVRSEVRGTIAAVLINDWVAVKKGDVLARIDTRDLELARALQAARIDQAQARLARAEAALETARREAERNDELLRGGVVSSTEHDRTSLARRQAEADAALAKAELAAERATLDQIDLNLARAAIRAPIDGVVAMRRANPGLAVEGTSMEAPLFKIVDLSTLDLRLSIPMSALGDVQVGQPLAFATDALPGREFSATIRFMNPEADPATRAIPALAEVDNRDCLLRAGLFVRATIELGAGRRSLEVPVQAVQLTDRAARTATVFVVEDGHAVARAVQIGEVGDRTIQVLSGLSEDDEVVARGAYRLESGVPVRIAETQKREE